MRPPRIHHGGPCHKTAAPRPVRIHGNMLGSLMLIRAARCVSHALRAARRAVVAYARSSADRPSPGRTATGAGTLTPHDSLLHSHAAVLRDPPVGPSRCKLVQWF